MFLGSHGDGLDSETKVPIVTWGAGLSNAKNSSIFVPVNIQQADVAPLMATLIGVPVPVNSVVCNNFKIGQILLVLIIYLYKYVFLGYFTCRSVKH